MSRFVAQTNDAEAAEFRSNRLAKSTRKTNKSAAETLRSYMRERGLSKNFEDLSAEQLNDIFLCHFIAS